MGGIRGVPGVRHKNNVIKVNDGQKRFFRHTFMQILKRSSFYKRLIFTIHLKDLLLFR